MTINGCGFVGWGSSAAAVEAIPAEVQKPKRKPKRKPKLVMLQSSVFSDKRRPLSTKMPEWKK